MQHPLTDFFMVANKHVLLQLSFLGNLFTTTIFISTSSFNYLFTDRKPNVPQGGVAGLATRLVKNPLQKRQQKILYITGLSV